MHTCLFCGPVVQVAKYYNLQDQNLLKQECEVMRHENHHEFVFQQASQQVLLILSHCVCISYNKDIWNPCISSKETKTNFDCECASYVPAFWSWYCKWKTKISLNKLFSFFIIQGLLTVDEWAVNKAEIVTWLGFCARQSLSLTKATLLSFCSGSVIHVQLFNLLFFLNNSPVLWLNHCCLICAHVLVRVVCVHAKPSISS